MKISVLLVVLASPAWAGLETLPLSKLRKLQKEDCVFIHPWANWCMNCVQELPGLMPRLAAWKGVKVVVVDTGTPFAQAQFARKWKVLTDSPLQTYLKPGNIQSTTYYHQIDPEWEGTLPHSVLFIRGVKKKVWRGSIDFDAVTQEVAALCR